MTSQAYQWNGFTERVKRRAESIKGSARAREYVMAAPLSSNPLNVAARTLTGSNPSHSLKTAEAAARCAHTCQGVKRVTEASGGFWRVISGAYGLGKNQSRPNGLHHLAAHGEHQPARASEHHKLAHTPSIIQGHTLSIIQGGTGEHHLARASEHHLARASEHQLAAHGEHQLPTSTSRLTNRGARAGITSPSTVRHQKPTSTSRHHKPRHGEAHLARNSRAHLVTTIRRHLGDANTGQTFGRLAAFKATTSGLHLRPPPVGNNNPGAQFFILYTFKSRLILYS
jgi:hypothetical protein